MATLNATPARYGYLPPQRMLLAVLGGILACAALSAFLTLRAPWLGIEFTPAPEGAGVRVESVAATHPNASSIASGDLAVALIDGAGRTLRLRPRTIMEEPDVLPSYNAFNTFLSHQGQLAEALRTPPLHLLLDSGKTAPITTISRPLHSLPFYFWWQLAVGGACLLISAGIWAYRRGQTAPRLLLISGLGAFGFTLLAAIYSSRELALSAELFRGPYRR